MGSGEGLPEAAAGGPPACTSIRIPPSGHGLISASGIYQEMEKNRKKGRRNEKTFPPSNHCLTISVRSHRCAPSNNCLYRAGL